MKITAKADSNHFQSDAARYVAYLETPEGRLRVDLAFANLQEFLGPDKDSLRALDLGCGTEATPVRLARLGLQVTLLDSSPAMLDLGKHAAQEAGVTEKITLKLGDSKPFTIFPDGRIADRRVTGTADAHISYLFSIAYIEASTGDGFTPLPSPSHKVTVIYQRPGYIDSQMLPETYLKATSLLRITKSAAQRRSQACGLGAAKSWPWI